MTRHATPLLGAVILLVFVPTVPAGEGAPKAAAQVARLPTVEQAIRYLESRKNLATPLEFRRWSGVRPDNESNDHTWTLADGVLLIGCIEMENGNVLISCWGRRGK
jgi:hypothetical protein